MKTERPVFHFGMKKYTLGTVSNGCTLFTKYLNTAAICPTIMQYATK